MIKLLLLSLIQSQATRGTDQVGHPAQGCTTRIKSGLSHQ